MCHLRRRIHVSYIYTEDTEDTEDTQQSVYALLKVNTHTPMREGDNVIAN